MESLDTPLGLWITVRSLPGPCRVFEMDKDLLTQAKSLGFSDRQIAHLTKRTEDEVRAERQSLGLEPSYRLVDTCAAEFEAYTPYYYSSYDRGDDEVTPNDKKKVMILGGGPNRIGQGIEFDYCCVHACYALSDAGYEGLRKGIRLGHNERDLGNLVKLPTGMEQALFLVLTHFIGIQVVLT